MEIGFPQGPEEKALALTGNQGTKSAMDWLMEDQDDPDVNEPPASLLGHSLGHEPPSYGGGSPEGPGSVRVDEKLPLSGEARPDQEDAGAGGPEAEGTRKKGATGGSRAGEAKETAEPGALAEQQQLQEDEMLRAVEEWRKEKAEEMAARQRVREKIERDKVERAKKFGGTGSQMSSPTMEPAPLPSSPSQEPPTK